MTMNGPALGWLVVRPETESGRETVSVRMHGFRAGRKHRRAGLDRLRVELLAVFTAMLTPAEKRMDNIVSANLSSRRSPMSRGQKDRRVSINRDPGTGRSLAQLGRQSGGRPRSSAARPPPALSFLTVSIALSTCLQSRCTESSLSMGASNCLSPGRCAPMGCSH